MVDKNKNIDKLIKQNLKIEEPSLDFSGHVMDQIYASDLKKEKSLSSLMQRHLIEEPSIDFAVDVLSKIEEDLKATIYQPVLGKKAWFFIGSLIVVVLIYTLFGIDSSSSESSLLGDLISKTNGYFTFDLPSVSISPLFALSTFALSSLLFLDYYVRNRRLS